MWPIDLEGFVPIRLLGSGGFGQVWLAEQTDLDRRVAVKIGHTPLVSPDAHRRFDRERRALGRLSGHRHIVSLHSSGISENNLPYLVMAYIDNGTLTERGPKLSEDRLRAVTNQLADAVGRAHEIGIIHRDLKPENVFIDRSGDAVLGDFGTARLSDSTVTTSPGLTASMAFVAPELLDGKQPSIRTDIYGIGITMVAAILGRSPFIIDGTETPQWLAMQVMKGETRSLPPGRVSPEFEALLWRCMDIDPGMRPSGTATLRNLLAKLPAPLLPADETTVMETVDDNHESPSQESAEQPLESTARLSVVTGAQHHTQAMDAPVVSEPLETSRSALASGSGQAEAIATQPARSYGPLLVGLLIALATVSVIGVAIFRSSQTEQAATEPIESASTPERSSGTFPEDNEDGDGSASVQGSSTETDDTDVDDTSQFNAAAEADSENDGSADADGDDKLSSYGQATCPGETTLIFGGSSSGGFDVAICSDGSRLRYHGIRRSDGADLRLSACAVEPGYYQAINEDTRYEVNSATDTLQATNTVTGARSINDTFTDTYFQPPSTPLLC